MGELRLRTISVVDLARVLGVDPEQTLKMTTVRGFEEVSVDQDGVVIGHGQCGDRPCQYVPYWVTKRGSEEQGRVLFWCEKSSLYQILETYDWDYECYVAVLDPDLPRPGQRWRPKDSTWLRTRLPK